MKQRLLILISSCIALVLLCAFWGWAREQGSAPMPVPSAAGGYYEEPFVLKLDAPANGKIYYTTDGSAPTTDSALYAGGIPIGDRSPEQNRYSSIRNVMTDWHTYIPDPTPVKKGTVVRAIYVSDWGLQSEILTQTYFVGISAPKEGLTLSLVFEYDDLFGEDGIYVTGKEYDERYLAGGQTLPAPVPNFEKRLEVTAVAEIMDSSGDIANQLVGLRIQGASMRGWYKKRFILECNAELSGCDTFPAELLQGAPAHSLMTKACKVDSMVSELVADRAVATQRSVPVQIYLNGEYWETTNFLERYDKTYFKQHYDVDDAVLVKNGQPNTQDDTDRYSEFMYWADHTDFSDESQWEQIQKEMDVQSYIDFISINYYLCNWDFSDDKNYLVWSSVHTDSSPYADQRWRWCIYDVDALELTRANYDVENAAEVNIFSCELPYSEVRVNETVLFRGLKRNEQFRQRFVLSFMDIVNNNFSPERVEAILSGHGLSPDWQDGYFQKRPDYAVQHLAEEFQLSGVPETVTICSGNPEMGEVVVNTSPIDLSSGTWSGKYFTDYPITVTASAKEGYRFVGWKGDANTAENTLTLPVDGGVTLEAVFADKT